MSARPTPDAIRLWLDDALPEAEMAAFDAALDSDPDFAEEVARMQDNTARYRGNDVRLQAAFPVEDALPANLVARLGLPVSGNQSGNVVNLAAARQARAGLRRWPWIAGGALAASIAIGLVLIPHAGAPDIGASESFQTALSQLPAGREIMVDQDARLKPVLSFAAADGRWCREFQLSASKGAQSGIACHADTQWKIETLTKPGTEQQATGGIQTAGGQDTAPLDAVYARLGASDPLTVEKEKYLIAMGWKKISH